MPMPARVATTLLLALFTAGCSRTPGSESAPGATPPAATEAAPPATAAREATSRKGPEAGRTLRILELKGTAYERGVEHGTTLRAEIASLVGLWKEDLRKSAGADPDAFIRQFLSETNFTPAIRKWTPELLEEVRGIADGSKQPFDTILAFQLVDELWVFTDRRAAQHCTSLGVGRTGPRAASVAQNVDLESFRDGFQLVLRIAGTGSTPEQLVFTSAGLIGMNGVNNRSIAVAVNTLMPLAASPDGLPVAFIVRGVLAQADGADAVRFIKSVQHASGQNYVIGTGDTVRDFEASAGKVVEFRPAADGSVVYHTNHPIANDDLKPWYAKRLQSRTPEELNATDSFTRLASIRGRLQRPAATIDEAVIKEALASKDSERHPVCGSLSPGVPYYTFGATIMTLSDSPSLQVTMGPPDVNPFVRIDFRTR